MLRQLTPRCSKAGAFRALLRDMQAARSGQLAFDFRLDAHQARIIELRPRRRRQVEQLRCGVAATRRSPGAPRTG